MGEYVNRHDLILDGAFAYWYFRSPPYPWVEKEIRVLYIDGGVPGPVRQAPVGPRQVALYYDHWTGLQNNDVHGLFVRMTLEEIGALKSGDEVWYDQDPLHDLGRVRGYVRHLVSTVDLIIGHDVAVHWQGGGMTTLLGKCFRLLDVAQLAALIAADSRVGSA